MHRCGLRHFSPEDEVVAANPLAPYDADWDWEFISTERMTRTLYRGLAGD